MTSLLKYSRDVRNFKKYKENLYQTIKIRIEKSNEDIKNEKSSFKRKIQKFEINVKSAYF